MSMEERIQKRIETEELNFEVYIDFRDETDIVLDGHFNVTILRRLIKIFEEEGGSVE